MLRAPWGASWRLLKPWTALPWCSPFTEFGQFHYGSKLERGATTSFHLKPHRKTSVGSFRLCTWTCEKFARFVYIGEKIQHTISLMGGPSCVQNAEPSDYRIRPFPTSVLHPESRFCRKSVSFFTMPIRLPRLRSGMWHNSESRFPRESTLGDPNNLAVTSRHNG